MRIRFTKMQGVGNDFMVVRWAPGLPLPSAEQVRAWADRRRGVGFDQLLVVEAEVPTGAAARYRVYNADGTEVEQCGNGARCIARFVAGSGEGAELRLLSQAGPVDARIATDGSVAVNLGVPRFEPAALPFRVGAEADSYRLAAGGHEAEFGIVSLGNPHAVIWTDSVTEAPVGILGPALGAHAAFPAGVNVGFAELVSRERIKLRVFERGAGETLACGTGAAAAVAVGRRRGLLDADVSVELPGGTLSVSWAGPGAPLWLTGPATEVYDGEISL